MLNKRKTTISYVDKVGNIKELKASVDVTDLTADKYLDKVVEMMRLQGYHDVAIWRSLSSKAYEMTEYFDSIVESKGEWNEINSNGEEDH